MANPRSNPQNLKHLSAGPDHPDWSDRKMFSAEGYVKLRVGKDHPLADPNGYAYEHLVIWVAAGNPRPPRGFVLHHRNETKSDNRYSNLELKRRDQHGIEHAAKLSDEQVVEMRLAYDGRQAHTGQLAERYGVPQQSVWKIITGKTRVSAGGPIQRGRLLNRSGRLLDGVVHDARPEVRA